MMENCQVTYNNQQMIDVDHRVSVPDEKVRYSRQIALPEIGTEGQEKLGSASVLVVGAGGLGCPALLYLASAGVGRIGIVDGDVVETENLHRQILYQEKDVGRYKTEVAGEKLQKMNSGIKIHRYTHWLKRSNAPDIIGDYDIVIDGTDNFPARYLINDTCILQGRPLVYGSVYRFEGQLSLFNYQGSKGPGPNYRDLFPVPPPAELVPDCTEAGVLGVIPGIIGSMQAAETLKVITGVGETLSGKLFQFDAAGFDHQIIGIEKRKDNPLSGKDSENPGLLEDYEAFCQPEGHRSIRETSPEELKNWMQSGEKIQLIDVRQPEEAKGDSISGELIPSGEIADQADKIDKDKKVILYCLSGARSAKAVRSLEKLHRFDNLYTLKGGLKAWKKLQE